MFPQAGRPPGSASSSPAILIGRPSCRSVPPRGEPTSTTMRRATVLGWGSASSSERTGEMQASSPSKRRIHSSRVFPRKIARRSRRTSFRRLPRRVLHTRRNPPSRGADELFPEPGLERPEAHVAAVRAPVRLVAGEHPGQRQGAPLLGDPPAQEIGCRGSPARPSTRRSSRCRSTPPCPSAAGPSSAIRIPERAIMDPP